MRFTPLLLVMTSFLTAFALQPAIAQDKAPGKGNWDLGTFLSDAKVALDTEATGKWKTVRWQKNVTAALQEAKRSGKPIYVFVFITVKAYLPWESGTQMCLGGRAACGTSLSDDAVIKSLNTDFVPLALNCKTDGFPKDLPGLKTVKWVYDTYANPEAGFSTSAVLSPDGKEMLGSSCIGTIANYQRATHFDPKKYASFLQRSHGRLDTWRQATSNGTMAGLRMAVLREIKDTMAKEQ